MLTAPASLRLKLACLYEKRPHGLFTIDEIDRLQKEIVMEKPSAFSSFFLFLLAGLVLAGCGTVRGIDEQVRVNPSDKTVIYRDSWVQRNPPEVHVQPVSAAPSDLKVLFIPFRVSQPMDNPTIFGYTVARTFWQTWLTMRVFPNLEFSGDDTPYRRDRAVTLARSRGADMGVG